MARGIYSVHGDAQVVSTAITVLELAAPATAVLEITKAWVTQSSITASTTTRMRLLRKTTASTGTASPPTPSSLGAEAASGATVRWLATVEGTDGNILDEQGFNYLNGYLWTPITARSRIIVPPSGIIALRFPAAPTSATWTFGFEYEEIG